MKKTLLSLLLSLLCFNSVQAELKVVTTLAVYASIAREIAGDAISVSSVVKPQMDPHHFDPRPSDVVRLQRSDLFIHSGLDLEVWRDPLITATGRSDLRRTDDKILDLSNFVRILEIPDRAITRADGDVHLSGNPHYWLSIGNGSALAVAIAERLIKLLPLQKEVISKNLLIFQNKQIEVNKFIQEIRKIAGNKKIIAYHNEWIYLLNDLGIQVAAYVEAQPGMPPTPSHIKKLRELLSNKSISLILLNRHYNSTDVADSLSEEYKVPVLKLAQQPGELEGTDTYSKFLEKNLMLIKNSL